MMRTTTTTACDLLANGVYRELPFADYLNQQAFGGTAAAALAMRTPAHWRASRGAPATDAQRLGTAVHTLVLEGVDALDAQYRVAPAVNRRTSAGKLEWADFELSLQQTGRVALSAEEHVAVFAMAESIDRHRAAWALLDRCREREMSLFWRCSETGVRCCARLDFYAPPYGVIAHAVAGDLKTARDASPAGFRWEVIRRGYHVQAGHYLAGMQELGLEVPSAWHFIVVESAPPWAVAVYELDHASWRLGARLAAEARRKYAAAEREGVWPAYPDMVLPLSVTGELPAMNQTTQIMDLE